jgi:hypothetical protein
MADPYVDDGYVDDDYVEEDAGVGIAATSLTGQLSAVVALSGQLMAADLSGQLGADIDLQGQQGS